MLRKTKLLIVALVTFSTLVSYSWHETHKTKSHFKPNYCFGNLLSFGVSFVLHLEEFFISIGVIVVERIR